MIDRILVAVDDSPAALAAARAAISAAVHLGAALRVVHVRAYDPRASAGHADLSAAVPRGAEEDALLRHVRALAGQAGISADTRLVAGATVVGGILSEARGWPAELIVIGRSGRTGPGEPYIGQVSRHVLELADLPVLVIPAPPRAR